VPNVSITEAGMLGVCSRLELKIEARLGDPESIRLHPPEGKPDRRYLGGDTDGIDRPWEVNCTHVGVYAPWSDTGAPGIDSTLVRPICRVPLRELRLEVQVALLVLLRSHPIDKVSSPSSPEANRDALIERINLQLSDPDAASRKYAEEHAGKR